MLQGILPYAILQYIVDEELAAQGASEPVKLPPLDELAARFGVSLGKLREELVVARAYGVVDMRPGDGTYVRPFDFYTAIRTVILYSIACDWRNFDHFYRLRVQVETGFWDEAVRALDQKDQEELLSILESAERRLKGTPAEIPNKEHRDFHLLMFRRLDNQFAQGILRVYWDAYEAVGLHRYFDYRYYESMWASHRTMAEAIVAGRYEEGKRALSEHFTLLENRLQMGSTGHKPDLLEEVR